MEAERPDWGGGGVQWRTGGRLVFCLVWTMTVKWSSRPVQLVGPPSSWNSVFLGSWLAESPGCPHPVSLTQTPQRAAQEVFLRSIRKC